MINILLLLIQFLVTDAHNITNDLYAQYSDAFIEVPEIIQNHGYRAEIHNVTSEDGYITTLHRIPSDKSNPNYKGPVIVIHPLLSSSAIWVISGKNSSLGFLLSNAGYDVWLMNLRGNYYSKGHINLTPKDSKYWKFSYQEMGVYDLPSTIDYILELTGNKNLLCVSHAVGGAVVFVTLSMKPEYNDKIRVHFSLSPGAAVPHLTTILTPIPIMSEFLKDKPKSSGFGEISSKWSFDTFKIDTGLKVNIPFEISKNLISYGQGSTPEGENEDTQESSGFEEIMSKESFDTTSKVRTCLKGNLLNEFCKYLIFYDHGSSPARIDEDTLPIIAGQLPAGAGVNALAHVGQGILTGKFACFDYGKEENLKIYCQEEPPLYPVEKIVSPTYIYHGANDRYAPPIDIISFASKLGSVIERKAIPGFGHGDLCYGKDADKYIYKPMLEIFSQYPMN